MIAYGAITANHYAALSNGGFVRSFYHSPIVCHIL